MSGKKLYENTRGNIVARQRVINGYGNACGIVVNKLEFCFALLLFQKNSILTL